MRSIDRRLFLQLLGGTVGASVAWGPHFAWAQEGGDIDNISLAWTSDPVTWDPNQRFAPDPPTVLKMVYDSLLDQDASMQLVPNLITEYVISDDAKSMSVKLRDDVTFSDGTPMTADDFRYTFFERLQAGHVLDLAASFGNVTDIEVLSPTEAVMRFSVPTPAAAAYMAFYGGFMVSKAYVERVGVEQLQKAPLGTGPYVLVEHQRDSRIVLDRREDYWGEKPSAKRITIEIIPDATARLAALESGAVDIAVEIPIRDIKRLQASGQLNAILNPIARIILITVRSDGVYADKNVRLAAHHAIDKQLLSTALYGGGAVPISVTTIPGLPSYPADFKFPYDPELAKQLLAASGYSLENPVTIQLATSNGQFAGDYDIARAVAQMWGKVGIKAEIQVITEPQWYELNASGKLPDSSVFVWDNTTGDPEMFAGNLFNAELPFSTYRTAEVTAKVKPLFVEPDTAKRIAGYEEFNRYIVEEGAVIPLLQAVQTVGFRQGLAFQPWPTGWIRPQAIKPA